MIREAACRAIRLQAHRMSYLPPSHPHRLRLAAFIRGMSAHGPRRDTYQTSPIRYWSRICVTKRVDNYTMATNLAIDPDLLEKALAIGGEKTKKATVNRALREFIARRGQERLLDLFGKLDWDGDYDYKRERTRK